MFDIEQELLEQCTQGNLPSAEDIRALSPERLLTLKDTQGRSLPHIILSHPESLKDPASGERTGVWTMNLIRYCPDLLKVSDLNDDTPLDLIYRIGGDIPNVLDQAYPHSFPKALTCICFSKHGKDIITRCWPTGKTYPVDRHFVDNFPSDDHPLMICRELGNEELLKEIYRAFPSNETYIHNHPELCTLLTWGDRISIQGYFESNYVPVSQFKFNEILPRLFDIGYDTNLIKKMINQLAESKSAKYNCSRDSLIFIITFKYVPQLIDIEKLPRDSELLLVTAHYLRAFIDSTCWDHQEKIIVKMFERLLEKGLFDVKFLSEKHYIPHFIPDFCQNPELAEKIIVKCAEQGFRDCLFTDVCYAHLISKRDSSDSFQAHENFFAWILPLFENQKIPIQLIPSFKSAVLHEIASDLPTHTQFYKRIRQIIPREQILEMLKFRNIKNFSPIDCLLSAETNKEKHEKIKAEFLKDILALDSNNEIPEHWYRHFVFQVLLYGNEELDAIFPLDKINHEALVKPEEYAYEYEDPFFAEHFCKSIERQRKFLEFMTLLPKNIQIFLLSDSGQMNRTLLGSPCFPFTHSSLLTNILESGDETMLHNFVSLGGKFEYGALIGCLPCKQLIPNMLELILDQFFKGSLKFLSADARSGIKVFIESADLTKSFMEYIFNKLGTHYRDFTVWVHDDKIHLNNDEFEMSFSDLTTQKAIDDAIDKYLRSKNFSKFADTEKLKENELRDYKDILYHNHIPDKPATPSLIYIVNIPDQQTFIIECWNPAFGKKRTYTGPYDKENVLDLMIKEVGAILQEQQEQLKALEEAFPEYKVELKGRHTEFSKDDDQFELGGIPSPEKAKKELEKCKNEKLFVTLAVEKGWEHHKDLRHNNLSVNIENAASNKSCFTFPAPHNKKLKLLALKNEEKLSLIFCEGANTLDASIVTLETAHKFSINYQTAKNIKFPQINILIHDRKSDVDFDRLNKLLISYRGSDYLNNYLKVNKKTYDILSTALRDLVSSCCQGKIKDWGLEDSKKLIIQLSHVLKKQQTDEDELRRFVCELALEASFCGWAISKKIISEYKTAFNLLQQDSCAGERSVDSIFTEIYAQAIQETIETMIKFARHPGSQAQSTHIESYLRSILKHIMSLPPRDMQDKYLAGEDDYPKDKVVKFFEAFFIPILIQKLMAKQKEDNDACQLLLESFAELIPLPEEFLKEVEEQKNAKLLDCEARLESANQELNELLIRTNHTQNLSAYHEVKSKIEAGSQEWLSLNKNLKDIEQNVARPQKQRKISLLEKQGDFSLDQERIRHQQNKINANLANLTQESEQLERLIGESLTEIEKLQNIIRKCKQEMEQILESFRAKKKWKAEELAEEQGLLASDEIEVPYLTLSGAARLLELKNYITKETL